MHHVDRIELAIEAIAEWPYDDEHSSASPFLRIWNRRFDNRPRFPHSYYQLNLYVPCVPVCVRINYRKAYSRRKIITQKQNNQSSISLTIRFPFTLLFFSFSLSLFLSALSWHLFSCAHLSHTLFPWWSLYHNHHHHHITHSSPAQFSDHKTDCCYKCN